MWKAGVAKTEISDGLKQRIDTMKNRVRAVHPSKKDELISKQYTMTLSPGISSYEKGVFPFLQTRVDSTHKAVIPFHLWRRE